jgi:hypothetical protein
LRCYLLGNYWPSRDGYIDYTQISIELHETEEHTRLIVNFLDPVSTDLYTAEYVKVGGTLLPTKMGPFGE